VEIFNIRHTLEIKYLFVFAVRLFFSIKVKLDIYEELMTL